MSNIFDRMIARRAAFEAMTPAERAAYEDKCRAEEAARLVAENARHAARRIAEAAEARSAGVLVEHPGWDALERAGRVRYGA